MAEPFHITRMRRELEGRTRRNPRYSLRAFSRSVGVDVSLLSKILNGRLKMSHRVATQVARHLDMDPDECREFLDSVARDPAPRQGAVSVPAPEFEALEVEKFRLIADLHHFAIMEMTHLPGAGKDAKWYAQRLGVSPLEARLAIDRLLSLGFLEARGERYRKTHAYLKISPSPASDTARRQHHRQAIRLADQALTEIPAAERHVHSVTLPADPRKLKVAVSMIEDFAARLTRFLSEDAKTSVYELQINLFPLVREDNRS